MTLPSEQAQQIAVEALTQAITWHDHFSYGFRYIGSSGRGFDVTAAAYRHLLGQVGSLHFQTRTASQLRGAEAKYFHLQNAVRFRSDALEASHTPGAIFHELVHALQDEARFHGAHWEWEATAYMAQALWFAGGGATSAGTTIDQQLFGYAQQTSYLGIFQQACERCYALGAGSGIPTVHAADLTLLRSRFRASELYAPHVDQVATGDGL